MNAETKRMLYCHMNLAAMAHVIPDVREEYRAVKMDLNGAYRACDGKKTAPADVGDARRGPI